MKRSLKKEKKPTITTALLHLPTLTSVINKIHFITLIKLKQILNVYVSSRRIFDGFHLRQPM